MNAHTGCFRNELIEITGTVISSEKDAVSETNKRCLLALINEIIYFEKAPI